ncbi:hypothetical protein [Paenibacillus amylolyticus]|uniref:hypothetical protein n=1 Tax=Paenibacillus amylolyticus TaxID=1451 RepID=UPI00201E2816|nr:hypothetical protein [Paenibacillus amylolyticus]MCL6661760.1 hypothetical protein [Paenibacillus amylolyticus]
MRNEGVDTLYLELGDMQEIESYLIDTAGLDYLGALETRAVLVGVTSIGTIPEHYKKLDASEIAKARYPDLFARLENALRTRKR